MTTQEIKKYLSELETPFVLVLIGPPLSGKDTFLRNLNLDLSMISRDQIVMDVYGSDDYDMAFKNVDQKNVDKELSNKFRSCSKNKENVVVNMTNMTTKRRKQNLSYFDSDYTKIAIIFTILDWEEYKSRNIKRKSEENKTIPEHVIKSMIASYQPIDKSEGFNKIIKLDDNNNSSNI
jgi:predicted kinase